MRAGVYVDWVGMKTQLYALFLESTIVAFRKTKVATG